MGGPLLKQMLLVLCHNPFNLYYFQQSVLNLSWLTTLSQLESALLKEIERW